MIWIGFSVIAIVVSLILVYPLIKPSRQTENRRAADLVVLKQNLIQIDEDQSLGLLSEEEAEEARTETQRLVLAAIAKADAMDARRLSGKPAVGLALFIAVGLCSMSLAVYYDLGRPNLAAEQPKRVAKVTVEEKEQQDRIERLRQRTLAKIEELTEELAKQPKNKTNLVELGRSHALLGNHANAAEAFGLAATIDNSDPELLADLGEALALAAGGRVTGPARAAFLRAQKQDAKLAGPRFFLALYDYQNSRPQAAYDKWLALIKELPNDGRGYAATLSQLKNVAKELGIDLNKELPARKLAPKRPAEQPRFVMNMVKGLADRLKDDPDDVPGWMKLGRSYMVLKQYKKAASAYAEAAQRKPKDTEILSAYGRALMQTSAPGQPLSTKSIAVFEQILSLDANHPEALWVLGWSSVLNRKLDTATAYWQRLLKITKPGTEQHKTLSAALAELKKQKR